MVWVELLLALALALGLEHLPVLVLAAHWDWAALLPVQHLARERALAPALARDLYLELEPVIY
jgi:hypothetical protein